MYVMDKQQWMAFILDGTRTGKLATVKPNGRPHVVPIWFIMEGDALVFSSGAETAKTRNLRQNPYATVCIDEEAFPYAFVMLECTATIDACPVTEQLPYTTEIARRYVPGAQAEEFGQRNAAESEVIIRLVPDKVIAWGGMSS